MKAAVVPEVNSSCQMKDIPQPQPGPNQVLVKMHASSICYTDVHLTLGHFPGLFPRILGHEPVGEIVAVARDVVTRKVGDRGMGKPLAVRRGPALATSLHDPKATRSTFRQWQGRIRWSTRRVWNLQPGDLSLKVRI